MTSHGSAGPDGASRPDRLVARVDDRLTRAGIVGDLRRDAALAVVVAVVSTALALVVLTEPGVTGVAFSRAQVGAALAVTVAQSLLLCLRRVRPVTCVLAIAGLQVVLAAVLPADGSVRGLAILVAAYTCGVRLPGRRAAGAVLGAAALEGAGLVGVRVLGPAVPGSSGALLAGQVLAGVVTYVAAAAVGGYVATRRRYVDLVRLRAAEAVAAQRARADAAIGLERARMARELHDVAAHHLTGMVVQAAVVERLVDRDPAAAKEAASWVRRQGRAVLDDLRQVVATLRAGDEPPEADGAPVPGLAALDGLVDAARALGTVVEVTRTGDARELAPAADVSFHRIAQESLANARDHAPGAPVALRLRYTASEVALEVEDAGVASAPGRAAEPGRGFGLAGMAERAQLIGATLEAGPTPAGGWRVAVVLRDGGPGDAS